MYTKMKETKEGEREKKEKERGEGTRERDSTTVSWHPDLDEVVCPLVFSLCTYLSLQSLQSSLDGHTASMASSLGASSEE